MKKVLFSLLISLMIYPAFSQNVNTLTISGHVVYTEATGLPVFQQSVNVSGPALNGTLATTTDLHGFYSFTIPNGSVIGPNQIYEVFTVDCNNDTISQQVSNQQGTVDFATVNFQVCGWFGGCEAVFSYESNFLQPNHINFTSNSSIGQDLIYFWDFGDGQTSTEQNPSHTYNSAGFFYACLYINNEEGNCANLFCDSVQVGQFDGCQAFFTYEQVPNSNSALFNATESFGNLESYNWLVNGALVGNSPIFTYQFPMAGVYQMCLQINSVGGCSDQYCTSVVITGENENCSASFIWEPSVPHNGQIVNFINTNPNFSAYQWFVNGELVGSDQNLTYVFDFSGTFQVQLVADGTGSNNNCPSSQYMLPVVVEQSNDCSSTFFYESLPNAISAFPFVNQEGQNFIWTLTGPNNQSTTFNDYSPYIDSLSAGIYELCLMVYVSGCSPQPFCQQIVVSDDSSNCHVSYVWTPSAISLNETVTFTNTSIGYTLFTWVVNNAIIGNSADMEYTFSSPGFYNVCLNATANSECPNVQHCLTFFIEDEILDCNALFTSFPLNNTSNSFQFIPAYQGPSVINIWSYTYQGMAITFTPPYTFPEPGVYEVCHEVIDSLNQCYQFECATVVVSGSNNPCSAAFNFVQSSPANDLVYTFTPAQANANTFEFIWYFGDGVTSTAYAPEHTFSGPGIYNVCLFLWNTVTGCQASLCNTIVVGSPDTTNSSNIDGLVYAGNNLADFGFAYLIKYDQVSNSLNLIALAAINNGYYMFNNIEPGQYLIKAALDYNSAYYANYLPTYFGSHLYWADAQPVIVSGSTNNNYVISLIFGSNPGGPGFVAGNVDEGANRLSEDAMNPVAMVDIILLDDNNVPQMWTKASYNGSYSLNNLAYGTYRMFADVPGIICIPIEFTISPDFPNLEIDIVLGDGLTFILRNEQEVKVGLLYPNPASELSMVNISNSTNQNLMIQLYDIQGRMMKQLSAGNAAEQLISIPLADLSSGIYQMVILQNGTAIANRKLVVTRP